MKADRWQRVEECYHAALERPPGDRAGFVAQACAGDAELRREVESLLLHEGGADELLESPVWEAVTRPTPWEPAQTILRRPASCSA